MNNFTRILFIFLFVVILLPQPAYAYLDPGTGSMVVQILVACFATVAIFFKSIWATIKGLFVKKTNTESEDEDEE